MSNIRCIMTVARTESRLLTRSWIFRFYTVISIIGTLLGNAILYIPGWSWSELLISWPDERIGVAGANGSGKSSLIKHIGIFHDLLRLPS